MKNYNFLWTFKNVIMPLLHGYDIINFIIGRFWTMNADTSDYCMAIDQSERLISLISVLIVFILM